MPSAQPLEISHTGRPGGVEEVRGLDVEERRLRAYELHGELPPRSVLPAAAWIERTIGQIRYETRMISVGWVPAPDRTDRRDRQDRALLRLSVLNRELESVVAPLARYPVCVGLVCALRDSDLERSRRELTNLRHGIRHAEVKKALHSLWADLSVFERISLMNTVGHP